MKMLRAILNDATLGDVERAARRRMIQQATIDGKLTLYSPYKRDRQIKHAVNVWNEFQDGGE